MKNMKRPLDKIYIFACQKFPFCKSTQVIIKNSRQTYIIVVMAK